MRGAFDWISRVVMLVLAGLVSLSIIGAIASIPSGSIETRMGVEPARQPVPQAAEEIAPEPPPPPSPSEPDAGESRGFSTGAQGVAAAPEEPVDPARWLEAITYALLALAGIAALGVLLLWRGLAEQRRIADALEALAHRA